jgi:large subunit ribosomal protein L1
MELPAALTHLKQQEKRKFDQSVDLIVTLKGVDPKRESIAVIATLPHPFQEKKVCGFLTKKSEQIPSILQTDFPLYKDAKKAKKLVQTYDFFVAHAKLMPAVASTFGKVLGPTGKMPSPQFGVLMSEDETALTQLLSKINTAVKIRVREPCVKVAIGKESMSDAQLSANILAVYRSLLSVLPVKKDNVKRVLLKTTMSAPVQVEMHA